MRIGTEMFSWTLPERILSTEASTLMGSLGAEFSPGTPAPRAFTLVSHRTGKELEVALSNVEIDVHENEILAWHYHPVDWDEDPFLVTIFND